MSQDSIAPPVSIEDRWVSVAGDEVPYLRAGDSGPNIVMVHGAGSSRNDWIEIMAVLSSNHRVFAADLIGFGDSPRRDIVHTTEYLGQFLLGFLDALSISRATLIGHSLGARICLDVALRRPEVVKGLVLISPLGFGGLSAAGRVLSTGAWWVNRLLRRRQPYPRLRICLEEPDIHAFSNIRCDSLLVWGSKDPYFPVANSERALKAIPNSALSVYEGAGHAAHRANTVRFTSDVQRFIQRSS